ncbi:MAG TPA: Hsp20 family protein [Methyloceanibacter sp.]|nr:Hsp20 family protein [Methyloceanibacter sp.]
MSRSRITFLDGNVWLTLAGPRTANGPAKAGDGGFPPYNVELLDRHDSEPDGLRITLAVAGFRPDDLELSIEAGELVIRGKQSEEQARDYLHRGIAARQFKRSFQLASGVEVQRAELKNGLLAIELHRPRQEKRVLKVGITAVD